MSMLRHAVEAGKSEALRCVRRPTICRLCRLGTVGSGTAKGQSPGAALQAASPRAFQALTSGIAKTPWHAHNLRQQQGKAEQMDNDAEVESAQNQIREGLERLVGRFQRVQTVDHHAFQQVSAQAQLLTRLLKHEDLVSKSTLNRLHMAAEYLRAEAPYHKKDTAALLQMADQLDRVFHLILAGECPEDRTPGVPRLV